MSWLRAAIPVVYIPVVFIEWRHNIDFHREIWNSFVFIDPSGGYKTPCTPLFFIIGIIRSEFKVFMLNWDRKFLSQISKDISWLQRTVNRNISGFSSRARKNIEKFFNHRWCCWHPCWRPTLHMALGILGLLCQRSC